MIDKKYDIVIIGGGLSGLLTGVILSGKGLNICVLEKNKEIGGTIQPFKRKDYFFETGMHFFGAASKGQIQYEFFKIAGILDELKICYNQKGFLVHINEKEYSIPIGFDAYEMKLIEYFPSELNGIKIYMKKIKDIIENLTIESIYSFDEKIQNMETGADEFISSITKNNDLKKLLKFNEILYYGRSGQCSLYLHALITGSFLLSTAEFEGGTIDFIGILLSRIKKYNGAVKTSKKVISFETESKKIISCTTDDGSIYYADTFIFSGHPSLLLESKDLNIIHPILGKRIKTLQNSPGAFSIYIIFKKNMFKYIETPVFFSIPDTHENDFLIHTPKSNSKNEFAGTLKIMTLMNINEIPGYFDTENFIREKEYRDFKIKKSKEIFEVIERRYIGFKNSIERYYTSTPLTIKDYTGSVDGSAYGIVHDYKNFLYSAIPIKTKFENFFLTGQNINFHGMTGVSITTLLTCSTILNHKIIQ
jgi:all-trans-retinol 13,14-reductase